MCQIYLWIIKLSLIFLLDRVIANSGKTIILAVK